MAFDAPTILALATLISSVAAAFVSVFSLLRSQNNGKAIKVQGEELKKGADTIQALEKNTNSMKDALVKLTGEAEHAKGVIQGTAEANAHHKLPEDTADKIVDKIVDKAEKAVDKVAEKIADKVTDSLKADK